MKIHLRNKLLIYRISVSVLCLASLCYILFIEPVNSLSTLNFIKNLTQFSVLSFLFVLYIFIKLTLTQIAKKPTWAPKSELRGAGLVYSLLSSLLFVVFLRKQLDISGFQVIVFYFVHIAFSVFLMIDNILTVTHSLYKYDLLLYWMIFPLYYLILLVVENYCFDYNRYHFLAINDQNINFYPIAIILVACMFFALAFMVIFMNRTKIEIEKIDEI